MRPTVDRRIARSQDQATTGAIPGTFPPSERLQAGYIRYVRILHDSSDGGEEIIKCETCIRWSPTAQIPSDEATAESPTSSNDQFYYTALSYAWGNLTPRRPILVDGRRRIIAENLWQFLQVAKTLPEAYGCWLWIDALSIDQSDAAERTHQVGIMSTRFRNADRVVVWLGQSSDDSDLAMCALSAESLAGRWVYDINNPAFSAQWTKKMETDLQQTDKSVADVLPAIRKICERPYWKRLWIPWEDFRSLWRVVAELGVLNEDTAEMLKNSLATRMITLRTKPMNFSLWNLLKETKHLGCADQHDRVCALLSVADEGHEGIEADYHVSLTYLGHQILRNRCASRPPASLEGVVADCDFLADILKLSAYDLFDYSASRGYSWQQKSDSDVDPSWAEWAEYHHHLVATKLLQNCE